MNGAFDRTEGLIGEEGFKKLRRAKVLVVGLGGVGGAAVEALARSGVGAMTLMDGDVFELSNLNRQIMATVAEIGKYKAEAAKRRVLAVSPDTEAVAVNKFFSQESADIVDPSYTYCVDAIDDIPAKVLLVSRCKALGVPVVSAMGAGNRTDCSFKLCDVFDTEYDPLARKLRRELKKAGIDELKVVCANRPPDVVSALPLSIAPPPMVMGAMLASAVIDGILS